MLSKGSPAIDEPRILSVGLQKLSTALSPRYYGVVTLVSILQVGELNTVD
jgi:hypothetical protein